ncbi:MAG: GNAT family N-acetyltransferase, partial [Microbacteriaceae bacterium]
ISPTGRNSYAFEVGDRMKRELSGISDEVRAVPPPPMPEVPAPYGIRLADPDADAEMISEWMNRPHLASTWGYDRPPEQWRYYLSLQLAGTYSRPFIAIRDGRDFAYIECYRAAKDEIAARYAAEPYDLGMHGAIADLEMIKNGHAQAVSRHIVASAFNLEPQCRRFMFDTDPLNTMGRRYCERLGCVFLGEHEVPDRRIALYALLRSPEDIPRLRETARDVVPR